MIAIRTLLLALVVALAACTPAPSPGPLPPDASDGGYRPDPPPDPAPTSLPVRACANLRAVGCPEGADVAACAVAIEAAQGTITDFHPLCIVGAKSQNDVRACGGVRCAVMPASSSNAAPPPSASAPARHR